MKIEITKFYMSGASEDEPSLCIIKDDTCYFAWDLNSTEIDILEEYKIIDNNNLVYVADHPWPDKTNWTAAELANLKPTSAYPALIAISIENYQKIQKGAGIKVDPKQFLTHHAKVLRKLIKEILKAAK